MVEFFGGMVPVEAGRDGGGRTPGTKVAVWPWDRVKAQLTTWPLAPRSSTSRGTLARRVRVCRPPRARTTPPPGSPRSGRNSGRGTGVVGLGLEIAAQVDLPGEAGNDAVDFVVGKRRRLRDVVVIGDRHEVRDADDTPGGCKGGVQNVGIGLVVLPVFKGPAGGADPETAPGMLVQDGREYAGRVEPRKATPVYGARRFRQAPPKTCRLSGRSRTNQVWFRSAG